MKTTKKTISILLAIVLVLGSIFSAAVNASAAGKALEKLNIKWDLKNGKNYEVPIQPPCTQKEGNGTILIALEKLNCSYCDAKDGAYYGKQLTSLDASNNTALVWFECTRNQLAHLDVSNNTALREFYCCENQLTDLDVSNNTALKLLACWDNQLTSLDLSNNRNLSSLYCDDTVTVIRYSQQ